MNTFCAGALSFLEGVYRDDIASFPFTTYVSGHQVESVYEHTRTIRSTLNCLLGLQEARKHHPFHPFLQRVDDLTARFVAVHGDQVTNLGDLGLLVVLLAGGDSEKRQPTRRALGRLCDRASDEPAVREANVQDLAWLLWGCLSAVERGLSEAEPVAHRLFHLMTTQHQRQGEVLPRNDVGRVRGPVVSFGASVYYVHAVYGYARLFDSSPAMDLFAASVEALFSCQREGGEWPWLLSSRDGRPLDVYPVFSVHQHSMAMFFLRPAAKEGFPEAEGAFSRSLSWMSGENQLGIPMFRAEPFSTYRAIERKALWPRAQRYARARWMLATAKPAMLVSNDKVMLNTESRSYELAWALYLLSGRPTLPGLG